MKRIGILGGTFNPVHIGHLTMAEMVREKLNLDKVLFVPSHLPPHKSGWRVIAAKDRYHMLKLAIAGNPGFSLTNFEIKRTGKSYSIDTVNYLRGRHPRGTKFFFIVGSDLVPRLHTWRKFDELKKKVTFIAVNRPDFKFKSSGNKVRIINTPGLQTSSSNVRQRLTRNKTVRYLVPDNVLNYIKKKKLYR